MKLLPVWIALVIWCAPATAQTGGARPASQTKTPVQAIVDRAKKLRADGHFDKAVNELNRALPTRTAAADRKHLLQALTDVEYNWARAYEGQYNWLMAVDHYDQALIYAKAVRKIDLKAPRISEANILNARGLAHAALRDFQAAIDDLEKARDIRKGGPDQVKYADTLNDLGLFLIAYADDEETDKPDDAATRYGEATGYLQEARGIHQRVANAAGEATSLRGLAMVHLRTGSPEEALAEVEQATALLGSTLDPRVHGEVLGTCCAVLASQGRYAEAESKFAEAVTLLGQPKDRRALGLARVAFGDGCLDGGKPREARKHYEDALPFLEDRLRGIVLSKAGDACLELGEHEKALKGFTDAGRINTSSSTRSRRYEGRSLAGFGIAHLGLKEPGKAWEALELSLPLLKKDARDRKRLGEAYSALGESYLALKNPLAAERFRQAVAIFNELGEREREGDAHLGQGLALNAAAQYPGAKDSLKKALEFFEENDPRSIRASHALGIAYCRTGEYRLAVDCLEKTRAYTDALTDPREKLFALCALGESQKALQQNEKAVESLNKALLVGEPTINERALTLLLIGHAYRDMKSKESTRKAVLAFEEAYGLFMHKDNDDRERYDKAVLCLRLSGSCYCDLSQFEDAETPYLLAIELFANQQQRVYAGQICLNLAKTYRAAEDYDKALKSCEDARMYFNQPSEQGKKGTAEGIIQAFCEEGKVHLITQELPKARIAYENARTNLEALKQKLAGRLDRQAVKHELGRIETEVLSGLGDAYRNLQDSESALWFYEKALVLQRDPDEAVRDQRGEATTLQAMGWVHTELWEYEKALERYRESLDSLKGLNEPYVTASLYKDMGAAHLARFSYDAALKNFQDSLKAYSSSDLLDPRGKAAAHSDIALCFWYLGRTDLALTALEVSRSIYEGLSTKDPEGESRMLNLLGCIYDSKGNYTEAIGFYEAALKLLPGMDQRVGWRKAIFLQNLGLAYSARNWAGLKDNKPDDRDQADIYLAEAHSILKSFKVRDLEAEGRTHCAQGIVYLNQKSPMAARTKFEYALAYHRAAGDPEGEITSLNNLMFTWRALAIKGFGDRRPAVFRSDTDLAIFYGKMAVNKRQEMRGGLRDIDREIQKGYVQSSEDTYTFLADLLLERGRIAEAEQVLTMLKEEEYYRYADNDPEAMKRFRSRVNFTEFESAWYDRLEKAITVMERGLAELGDRRRLTRSSAPRSPNPQPATGPDAPSRPGPQTAPIPEPETITEPERVPLSEAERNLLTLFSELSENFEKAAPQVNETPTRLAGAISELDPHTVGVLTLVGLNRTWLVAVAADGSSVRHEVPVSSGEIRRAVEAFRADLKKPVSNAHENGQALYKLIVAPLEEFLDKTKAETILWSLDGRLRYVPMGALWDGKKYLVERWSMGMVSLSALDTLTEAPVPEWTVLGAGVSTSHRGFTALTYVPAELAAIVRGDKNDERGLLPGAVLLNPTFTKDRLIQELGQRRPVVHIASHFELKSGALEKSSILLGNGEPLSIEDFRTDPHLDLSGVDLLTLSACETAVGVESSNGHEVEGFGLDINNNGRVKAVLASLWSVADQSTALLMREFYKHKTGGLNKAKALQEAQIAMLKAKPMEALYDPTATGGGSIVLETTLEPKGVSKFQHPYYWAPFVLIGNCR